MQVLSLTEARNNLKSVFDSVYIDNDEVIIHRKGKENVVVISMDEYNSMKETNYLLSSPANKKSLLRSLNDARNDKIIEKEYDFSNGIRGKYAKEYNDGVNIIKLA